MNPSESERIGGRRRVKRSGRAGVRGAKHTEPKTKQNKSIYLVETIHLINVACICLCVISIVASHPSLFDFQHPLFRRKPIESSNTINSIKTLTITY